jgi:N-acetylglucosaminyl-diphospho-decaprenol L-rhamnosyltransferase
VDTVESAAAGAGRGRVSTPLTRRPATAEHGPRAEAGAPAVALQPLVSVVIVTYHSEQTIDACLGPLAGHRLQLIVVNNDQSSSFLRRLADTYGSAVELHSMGRNAGFGAACNVGLAHAESEVVLFLNPDASITFDDLMACRRALLESPDVGAMTCRLITADGSLDHACKRNIPTPTSSLAYFLRRFGGRSTYTAPELGEFEIGEVEAINGAFMLGPAVAFRAVGGFDETFWMYGEDLDLCLRLRNAGWRILYWPEVTAIHLKGASSGSRRSWLVNRAFHRSMLVFFSKHYPDSPLGLRILIGAGVRARMLAVYLLGWLTVPWRRRSAAPARPEAAG